VVGGAGACCGVFIHPQRVRRSQIRGSESALLLFPIRRRTEIRHRTFVTPVPWLESFPAGVFTDIQYIVTDGTAAFFSGDGTIPQ
jgi:hypothetical protein